MWLTLLALRNRIGILMLSLAMVVLGATSLNRLPVDLFPNIQVPVAFVGVIYKGAPPLDIEQSVVYPIEKAVSSASNVEHVESFSKQGIGAVQVWFNWGADINVGQMEVMQRITQILNNLPPGVLQPFVVKFDVSNIPVAFVTVSSDNLDERALYDLAFNTIAPQIEQINNVAAATVEGGKVRQININLDPALLQARALSILDVVQAVKAANLILPSGDIKAGNLDYNVFTNNQFKSVAPINDVVVKVNALGNPVRVRDVGTVTDSSDIQTNIVRTDGKRSVYLRVNKQPAANTVEVVDGLHAALPRMIGIPPGVHLGVSFDQSLYIRMAISNLTEQALHGSVLAAGVILIFLRNLTSTLIISVAIPLSVLTTFIVLYFSGMTLNVFTLGGLALGIGRLVDDSIVELENIQRHLNTGQKRWEAIVEAAREVAMPIFASTVTTVIVFLPIFFVVGIARLLLIPLTLTIAISLFTSFLISRTVTPALCFKYLKPEQEAHRGMPGWWVRFMDQTRRMYDAIDDGYQQALTWTLGHKKTLVAVILLVFGGLFSGFFSATIGTILTGLRAVFCSPVWRSTLVEVIGVRSDSCCKFVEYFFGNGLGRIADAEIACAVIAGSTIAPAGWEKITDVSSQRRRDRSAASSGERCSASVTPGRATTTRWARCRCTRSCRGSAGLRGCCGPRRRRSASTTRRSCAVSSGSTTRRSRPSTPSASSATAPSACDRYPAYSAGSIATARPWVGSPRARRVRFACAVSRKRRSAARSSSPRVSAPRCSRKSSPRRARTVSSCQNEAFSSVSP